MEVQDGFIVGIFNYCDAWCERCAFTSRCRLFADRAEMEASLDPALRELVEAPPLPEDVPPPPPAWMQPMPTDDWEHTRPRVLRGHEPIVARARDYGLRAFQWLSANAGPPRGTGDPREVVAWFHYLIGTKAHRALAVWPDEDPDEFSESDCDGSAKVALIGIDRSHAAWLELVERGAVSPREADAFIADLIWLGDALEHARPKARAFVRPGFDEPDEVARLLAEET